MKLIRTFDPRKNRYVVAGNIQGDTFVRKVTKKHFVWKYKGYGLQKDVFEQINNVKYINIVAPKGVYKATLETWLTKGIMDDLGNGRQRFLPVEEMEKLEPDKV